MTLILTFPWFINQTFTQEKLIGRLEQILKIKLEVGSSRITAYRGIGVVFSDIAIQDKQGRRIATADDLVVRAFLIPLFHKKLVVKEILLQKPTIYIYTEKDSKQRRQTDPLDLISEILKEKPQAKARSANLKLHQLRIVGGSIEVMDKEGRPLKVATRLRDFNMNLDRGFFTGRLQYSLSGKIYWTDEIYTSMELKGSVNKEVNGSTLATSAALDVKNLNLAELWHHVDPRNERSSLTGLINLHADIEGSPKHPLKVKSQIIFDSLEVDYPAWFNASLTPGKGKVTLQGELTREEINLDALKIFSDEVNIEVNDFHYQKPPEGESYIRLVCSTPYIASSIISRYIPVKLIDSETWYFLAAKAGEGYGRIEKLVIEGNSSELANLEKPENKKSVEGIFTFRNLGGQLEGKYLRAHGLTGSMELIAGDLFFKKFTGYYGNTWLESLDGVLRDVHSYINPLTLDIAGVSELKEAHGQFLTPLFGQEVNQIADDFKNVSGKAEFRMNLEIEFGTDKPESFRGLARLEKAALRHESIPVPISEIGGEIFFSDAEIVANNLTAVVGSSSGEINGGFLQYQSDNPILDVRFSTARLKETHIIPLVFSQKSPQPSGYISGQIHLVGPLNRPHDYNVGGNVGLHDVYLEIPPFADPLEDLSGEIDFFGQEVEFSIEKGRFGEADLNIVGKIERFDQPSLYLELNSTNLNLASLFNYRERSDRDDKDSENDEMDFRKIFGKANFSYCYYNDFKFSDYACNFILENKKWDISEISTWINGGLLRGEIKVEPSKENSKYNVSFSPNVISMDVSQFMRNFNRPDKKINGRLDFKGKLKTSGSNFQEMLQGMKGGLNMRVYDGKINTSKLLASIFSVLDIFSILNFDRPDFNLKGLNFTTITGELNISGSKISSPNFMMDFDTFKILAFGEVDMQNEELDMEVGIRPTPFRKWNNLGKKITNAGKKLADMAINGNNPDDTDEDRTEPGEKEKKLRTVDLLVKGTLQDPEVKPKPLSIVPKSSRIADDISKNNNFNYLQTDLR